MQKRLPFAVVTSLALALAAAMWMSQSDARAVEGEMSAAAGLPAAAAFTLPDTNGKSHSLADYQGKYVVLEWTNPDCPFVKKFYDARKMQELQKEFTDKGVVWLSICSSAPGKQGHYEGSAWGSLIEEKGIKATAVLLDPDGKVGHLYDATNTPHIYIVNPDGKLIYQGAIDDKPSADPADLADANNYVQQVLGAALLGKTKAYGCTVKY